MTKRSCHDCTYAYWDPCQWLVSLSVGWPGRPVCANHPDSAGRMRPAPTGGVCRNFRPKPATPTQSNEAVRQIPLARGQIVFVDAADYEWLSRHKWSLCGNGYAGRFEHGKLIYMHREIMQPPKGMVVDHIDGNRLDNCRSNLRIGTHSENMYNQAKRIGSASSFRGVFRRKKDGRCYAMIFFQGRAIWLGFYDEEVEAARVYDRKAVELGIEFARLNFPEEWPPERRQEVYANRQEPSGKRKAKGKKAKRKIATPRAKTPTRKGRKRSTQGAKRTMRESPHKARQRRTQPRNTESC